MNDLKKIVPELYADLSDLLSTGRINRAMQLTRDYSQTLGKPFYFSHIKWPHYPTHNLDAKTAFVHLNPGTGLGDTSSMENFLSQKWDKEKFFAEHSLPANATLDQVVEMYKYESEWYARKRFGEKKERDNFDFKQACFLKQWPDSGIELQDGYDHDTQRINSINVIDQKLQLELFPYGSNTISTHLLDDIFRKHPELITPYIEKLFDFIVLHPRKYVLFGSRVFDTLFQRYDSSVNRIIDYISPEQKFEGITKNRLSFTFIRLKWNGKVFDAGIAHSFPRRDLPNAFEKMEEYGRLCAEYYLEKQKSVSK